MKRLALWGAVIVVLITIVALVVAEMRFGLIRAGKPESHGEFVTGDTRARILIRPLMAQNLFDAWIPSDRKPPTWLLTRVLPHELAFVFSPDIQQGESGISFYVNEQRLGPVIANLVNQSNLLRQQDHLRWNGDGMTAEKRGSVVAHGTLKIPDRVTAIAQQHWGIVQGLEPLEVEGTHFVEAIFDNRDGGAFVLMCALYTYGLLGEPQAPLEDEYDTFLSIASIHVVADTTPEGDLQLVVTLKSSPSARGEDIDANAFNLEVAIGEFARVLRDSYGAELRGRAFTEGSTVTGRYTVKNVSGIISALLAAQ